MNEWIELDWDGEERRMGVMMGMGMRMDRERKVYMIYLHVHSMDR